MKKRRLKYYAFNFNSKNEIEFNILNTFFVSYRVCIETNLNFRHIYANKTLTKVCIND